MWESKGLNCHRLKFRIRRRVVLDAGLRREIADYNNTMLIFVCVIFNGIVIYFILTFVSI